MKIMKCKNCSNWVIDIGNEQDRKHAMQDRKLCAMMIGDMGKGHYFHAETDACRKFSDIDIGYKVG